ncbi:MAG: acyl-CoA dehydrogenase family protein [Chloroflexi bacterium]|nr:acyl-CoA dehydrogenase family protein [Chloroflexota bacterium]
MQIQLNEQQLMLQKTVREFCEREVLPVASDYDLKGEFPADIIRRIGDLGVPGLLFPSEYGGSDGDMLSFLVALEELARADASVAITVEVNATLCGELIHRFGTEEQKSRWLTPLAKGTMIASFALTEPEAGSDSAAITTTAVRDNDEWVINGSKSFITNSGTEMTGFVIVAAVTSRDEAGKAKISNIIVPKDTPGYSVGPSYNKMGWRASPTHPLYFQDCRVPATNIIGTEGKGLSQFLWSLDIARVAIAALGVGLIQACLDRALSYAQQRRAFGKTLSQFQAIQFSLADMETAAHMGRLATYHAGNLIQQGLPFSREAAIAKLFTSEAALKAADQALQIHGGMGFMDDGPVARYYRDAKILTIAEGTSEVQRMIIARELGCV